MSLITETYLEGLDAYRCAHSGDDPNTSIMWVMIIMSSESISDHVLSFESINSGGKQPQLILVHHLRFFGMKRSLEHQDGAKDKGMT